MFIPETSSTGDQNIETNPFLIDNERDIDMSASKCRHGRHGPRLPTVRRGHAHVPTTRRKMHGRRFWEIIVFREYTKMNNVSGADTNPSCATRTEQCHDGGAIFMSKFPSMTTQEELPVALGQFGEYE